MGLSRPTTQSFDNVKHAIKLSIALAALWLLLSGHFEPLILGLGAVSIAIVVWLATRMRIIDTESYPFRLVPRLSTYWFWLLVEIVKANIDVARRALGPKSKVQPIVFDVPADQVTDLGLVIYANSITLTPGTVSLDLKGKSIRVHALHAEIAEALNESGMNRRVPESGSKE